MKIYIIQRRLDAKYNWNDYWVVGDLETARKMVKKLRDKYREEFRLVKEYRV